MKKFRALVPALGVLALIALFFKLPDTPNLFGFFGCKACSLNDPFLPLIGIGYFAALVASSLFFPSFPGRKMAIAGVTWSLLLFASLTYIDFPNLCIACLIGHACNILIWIIWAAVPAEETEPHFVSLKKGICLVAASSFSVIALFGSLNLTFMAYGYKYKNNTASTSFKIGDLAPNFSIETLDGKAISKEIGLSTKTSIVFNFVSPDCPHCKDQLKILNAIAGQFSGTPIRFINVSPSISNELVKRFPNIEWAEDKDDKLLELFRVTAYPTLIVIGPNSKIDQIIPGVPDQLKKFLTTRLTSLKE